MSSSVRPASSRAARRRSPTVIGTPASSTSSSIVHRHSPGAIFVLRKPSKALSGVSGRCCQPSAERHRCRFAQSASALRMSRGGLASSLLEPRADGAGIERADHRLDRADRGRRDREIVDADADQRHRLQRPAAHLAAQPDRHVGRVGLRRRRASGSAGSPGSASRSARPAAGRRGRRRTGIGSGRWCRSTGNRPAAAAGRAFRRGSALRASRRIRSARGSWPLATCRAQASCSSNKRARLLIFPRLGDHREHHPQHAARATPRSARGPAPSSASTRSSARRSARQPIAGFSASSLSSVEIGQRLVAADVDGAEDDRLVAGGVEHLLVEPLLALAARAACAETRNWNSVRNRPMPSAPVEFERGGVLGQAGIDHQRDARRRPWSIGRQVLERRHIRRGASGSAPCAARSRWPARGSGGR